MLRRNILTAFLLTSILFSGCTVSDSTSTEPVSVVVEDSTSEEMEEDVSEEISEEIPTLNETGELNNVIIEIEGNIATVNGREYEIAPDEMNYSGGYMYYFIGNSTMKKIMTAINSGDISEIEWRWQFTEEHQQEAEESTKLEDFVEAGGTILNYYILNSSNFVHSRDYGEVPIAVEYTVNGEVYGTIVIVCILVERSVDDVYYGVVQILHTDTLDEYHIYDD